MVYNSWYILTFLFDSRNSTTKVYLELTTFLLYLRITLLCIVRSNRTLCGGKIWKKQNTISICQPYA